MSTTLTKEDLRKIRRLLEDEPQKMRIVILLLITTGAKVSDIYSLKWGQVDLERRAVTYYPARGSNYTRYIPSKLAEDMREFKETERKTSEKGSKNPNEQWVFTADGENHMSPTNITQFLKTFSRRNADDLANKMITPALLQETFELHQA